MGSKVFFVPPMLLPKPPKEDLSCVSAWVPAVQPPAVVAILGGRKGCCSGKGYCERKGNLDGLPQLQKLV